MAEAKLNKDYAIRLVGVGAMLLAICAWSIYDGKRAWPQQNKRLEMVSSLLLSTNLTAEAWIRQDENGVSMLDKAFARKGLKTPSKLIAHLSELCLPERLANDTNARVEQQKHVVAVFGNPVYSDREIKTQSWQAAITFLLGLLAFASVWLKVPVRYRADEQGLSGNGFGARPLPYTALQSIDWTRWDAKGIAVLTFDTGTHVTLDAWHYAGIKAVVAEIVRARPDLQDKSHATGVAR